MAMKKITKIVTFYDDGTFSESTPSREYIPSAPSMPVFHPPQYPPTTQPWPSYPPYTIWCKTADGTMSEMTLTSPIVAQGTTNDNSTNMP